MIGYFIVLIIFICLSIHFGCVISFHIIMRIVQNSNMAKKDEKNFYYNTKKPMRVHVYTASERFNDVLEHLANYEGKEF